MVKSPINFKDWLHVIVVVVIAIACVLALKQIPFVDSVLDSIGDFVQSEHIY